MSSEGDIPPTKKQPHTTYFQQGIRFMLGDDAHLNRVVPREVGEKHINDLLGRHPYHPYDPSIDDSIATTTSPPQVVVGDDEGGEGNTLTAKAIVDINAKFVNHAWACWKKQQDGETNVNAEQTAGAGSYLNLPYLTHPQDHPCYIKNKEFGTCMQDPEKAEMELFMKHVNCFHPYKVDLMKCITRHTRTFRLKQQQQSSNSSGATASTDSSRGA